MIKITKGVPPAFFSDYMTKKRPKEWEELAPIRAQLRQHILKNEQKGYCAYTEIKIKDKENCHIDHYHTRNLFPTETFDYNNLIVSCNSEKYGAKYKDKHIKTKTDYNDLVNPVKDIPSECMEYTFEGKMQGITNKGKKTISYFNLNERTLINRRRDAICSLQAMKSELSEDELVETIGEFETMIRQLYKGIQP